MIEDGEHAGEVEVVVRPRQDKPEAEIAGELENEEYGYDPHIDLDFESKGPSGAERQDPEAISGWRVARSLLKLRAQIDSMAPSREKRSDGTIGDDHHCGGGGRSDHCPNVRDGAVGVVTAIDITHDPAGGCDCEVIAKALAASRDARVKYIIWNRRIANSSAIGGRSAWEWRPYSGANPHNKHIHVSVKSAKSHYDDDSSWTAFGDGEEPSARVS